MDLHETLVPASANLCIVLAMNECGLKALFTLSLCLNFILLQNFIVEDYSLIFISFGNSVCLMAGEKNLTPIGICTFT